MKNESLYCADIFIVGTGLFGLNQLTLEARDVLQSVNLVMHLTSVHSELLRLNSACEDLSALYWREGKAWDVYQSIAAKVVAKADTHRPVAFASDGHALFFDDICWEVTRLAREGGLVVQALPGISSFDVLPIQLGFDPGDLGTQIFDATQLVMYELDMNPYLSTLVLQVTEFGVSDIFVPPVTNAQLAPLFEHLLKFYPPSQRLVFARSRSTPDENATIVSTTIADVPKVIDRLQPGMTLYIPRKAVPAITHPLFSNSFPEARNG